MTASAIGPRSRENATAVRAVQELVAIAARVGITVTIEPFSQQLAGKGGLCRVAGRSVIVIDSRLPAVDQAGILGRALSIVKLDGIEIPPSLRAYVSTGHAHVRPLLVPRPLARAK